MEEEEDVAVVGAPRGSRRRSLASQMEEMASDGAFLRAIEKKSPQINVCRTILRKPTGKRTLEDIHVLDRLYQSLEIVAYNEKGTYVFHEGDDGDSFYLVYSGRVDVVKNDPSRVNGIIRLVVLGPGDTFGERALLSSTDVRSASVIVLSAPTELVFINRVVFSELLKESHDSSNTNTLEITKRFRSNKDIVRNIFMRSSAQRSEKDLKFAVEYLKSVKFFSRFSFEVRKQLCNVMRLVSAVTNTVLFAEGQVGRHFYIIFTGCVDVSVRAKNRFEETKESVVSRLGEGEYFGELALSQADGVRRATVVCTEFCELLVLGRDEYEPLIKKYQNEYHAQYAQMLRKNPYFLGPEWDDNTIEGMCSVMTEKYIPYKGEVCKQGSRASELFIVTRGECRIINEGKHPITNARQMYELGRYGPNSVLGCAEASAGRFNDIFIREYSILAESPMKILVLSRFDIFHLMSAEARASLQRSSNGYIRESIQSRALKSVAWEKYKKAFISSVMTESHPQAFGSFGGRPDRGAIPIQQVATLGKSQSAPLLPLNDARVLVDPGSLVLERRRGVSKISASGTQTKQTNGSPKESQESAITAEDTQNPSQDNNAGTVTLHTPVNRSASVSSLQPEHSTSTKLQHGGNRAKLPPVPHDEPTSTPHSLPLVLARSGSSKTLNRRSDSSNIEKSTRALLTTAASPTTAATMEFRSELRRCGRIRVEKLDNTLIAAKNGTTGAPTAAVATAATIWDPIHGVCQPFVVLGFMKEQAARPASRCISLSLSASKTSRSAKSAADQLRKAAVAAVSSVSHPEFTRFRVFGKFRDIEDALELFRQICAVEKTAGISDVRDCSRFAVYKEDEMTMALENFPSVALDGSEVSPNAAQFSAADLPQATGQRFACVSVCLQPPGATCIEAIVVHVYQCFPTPQSAVRFARQVATTLLAPGALNIIPLFEWIVLTELERFDARNNDLEQELELAMRRGGQESTWKARKEAVKRGGRQHNPTSTKM
ncbi:cAMP-dependent protein kinase regulatory subunit [Phytophthora citrophthora]|uniref:cAMP-dependent protein kinase regulatory subunit n=1 Tax=Phytophthora citrophthora TaxID=4793 RepID=A0AAD9G4V2_9STRA|nr:cAMP-dependent protein kinase regulatory subunit [Phytophthora citrophthora]